MSFRPEHFKPVRKAEKKPAVDRSAVALTTLRAGATLVKWGAGLLIQQAIRRHQLEGRILQLACDRMGILSVSDAVRELGASWSDCEAVLAKLAKKGCCTFDRSAYIFAGFLPLLWSCEYCDGVHTEGPTCPSCGAGMKERPVQLLSSKDSPSPKGFPC